MIDIAPPSGNATGSTITVRVVDAGGNPLPTGSLVLSAATVEYDPSKPPSDLSATLLAAMATSIAVTNSGGVYTPPSLKVSTNVQAIAFHYVITAGTEWSSGSETIGLPGETNTVAAALGNSLTIRTQFNGGSTGTGGTMGAPVGPQAPYADAPDYIPLAPMFYLVSTFQTTPSATPYTLYNPLRTVYGLVWDGNIEIRVWRLGLLSSINPAMVEQTPPILDTISPLPSQYGTVVWQIPDGEWIASSSTYTYHILVTLSSHSGGCTLRFDFTSVEFARWLSQTNWLVVGTGHNSPPAWSPVKTLHDMVWGLMGEI